MYYFSTRDKNIQTSASNAIIQGLSQDGGLFVCDLQSIHIDIASLINASYQEMAYTILKPFLPTFTEPKLKACIKNAYTNTFSSDDVTPLVKLDEKKFILELFHGPTAAFKDVALSLLPHLLLKSKEIENDTTQSLILTATSGDTGKAALEGFKDVENTKIMVFYPLDGVSAVQERQMNTTLGANTKVIGIHGNFDDAQNAVKFAFNSSELLSYAKEHNYVLSSANSINIGRLLPQVVYYFYSYVTLLRNNEIYLGEEINFSVPTGNFGDIFAGYIAKSIGLPIHMLICGSNDNNVLFEFLSTGHYNRKKELIKTISPSMDILVSSNLERLLYYVSKDTDYVKELMEQLKEKGEYELKKEYLECIQKEFYPSFASTKETKQTIHDVYHSYSYVLDPHSAVAYKANKDYVLDTQDQRKCVILSTASPCKFTDAVLDALHIEPGTSSFDNIHVLNEQANVEIPKNLMNIDKLEIRHNNKIEKADILTVIKEYMNE